MVRMTNATAESVLVDLAHGMTAGSVRELLVLRAGTSPDRSAYSSAGGHRRLTYGALAGLAAQWRWALAAAQIRTGARVGVWMDEPVDFIAAYLSLLAAGRTVVPLDPDAPLGEVERIAGGLGLDLVVTDRHDALTSARLWRLCEGRPPRQPGRPPGPRSHDSLGRPSVLLMTSGTTGDPKMVPLPEWQLLHRAQLVAAHHRLGAEDRGYSALPLFHVNAQVVGVLATLVAGSSLVTERRFHRTGFWERMDAERITWINAVPAILAILGSGPPPEPAVSARVRFARSASAPLPEAVRQRFEERCGVRVLETYGMTEAGGQITANPLDPALRRPGSAGLPVGIQLRIVGADRVPVPSRTLGLVEIRGGVVDHCLMVGSQAKEHVELRIPVIDNAGWLSTGDVGWLDGDGYLFLRGRADDVINCGGEKVYPREVEEVLRADARVAEAVVVGQPHPILGHCPVAAVTAVDGAEPAGLAAELVDLCASRLSRAKRPHRIIVTTELPTGSNGKVSRRMVERQLWGAIDRVVEAVSQEQAHVS
jgi:acyl-CoA synthetase (AMP-forming)/AMP-acid ligase II